MNQISPFQFKIFWKEYVETNNSYIQKDRICYIACILDEPKPIVRTVFRVTKLYKTWGTLNKKKYYRLEYNSISYCPSCIKDGFHGNFHESNWIKKCPIHNIYLIAEPLQYSSIAKSKADRYLLHLMSLLDAQCPGWEITQRKDVPVYNENKNLKQFINWRITAEKAIENIPTKCIGAFGSSYDFYSRYKIYPASITERNLLIQKLGWTTPIPNILSEMFDGIPLYSELQTHKIPKQVIDIQKNLLLKYEWCELFDLYILACVQKDGNCSFQRIAKSAINKINLAHPQQSCNCTWGIEVHGAMLNCLPGELQHYTNYYCPYLFAINELKNKWLYTFITDKNSYSQYRMNSISSLLKNAEKAGDISIVGYSIKDNTPILVLNWPDEIAKLLHTILEKIVEAHVFELETWLASIKTGGLPNNRKEFLNNIYLISYSAYDTRLLSWPSNHLSYYRQHWMLQDFQQSTRQ